MHPTNHAGLSLLLHYQYFKCSKNTRAICCEPMQRHRLPPVSRPTPPRAPCPHSLYPCGFRSNFVGQLPPDHRGAWLRLKFHRDLALCVYMRCKFVTTTFVNRLWSDTKVFKSTLSEFISDQWTVLLWDHDWKLLRNDLVKSLDVFGGAGWCARTFRAARPRRLSLGPFGRKVEWIKLTHVQHQNHRLCRLLV